jgi:general secretion pathway protein A
MATGEPAKAPANSVVKLVPADESKAASVEPDEVVDATDLPGAPVYASFYGLKEAPFDLTPNPTFLFLTPRQREALSNIRYGLSTAKGFVLVLGDAGTGKTTMLHTAISELDDTPSRYVLLSNPTLSREEFYEFLAREFELSAESRTSKTTFLSELKEQVESRFEQGGVTGLIIDEAQSMPHTLLEEVRLLGNIETRTTKLLNIVLSGQPELANRLNEPSLRQLKQRIALRCELRPLTLTEMAAYVAGRLRIAGGSPANIFTEEAITGIFEASGGIPRTINVLCENALISGFAAQLKPATRRIVQDVCRDFDVASRASSPAETRAELQVAPPAAAPASGVRTTPSTGASVERPMFSSIDNNQKKRRFKFF